MIRRNHIQTVTRIDRPAPRYYPKPSLHSQTPNLCFINQQKELVVDQNFRATSNNKKYHQYKDWKEQTKKKTIHEDITEYQKKIEPLADLKINENIRQNSIRKEYQRQMQEVMKKQYASSAEQEVVKRRSFSSAAQPFSYLDSKKKYPNKIGTNMEESEPKSAYRGGLWQNHLQVSISKRKENQPSYQHFSVTQDQPLFPPNNPPYSSNLKDPKPSLALKSQFSQHKSKAPFSSNRSSMKPIGKVYDSFNFQSFETKGDENDIKQQAYRPKSFETPKLNSKNYQFSSLPVNNGTSQDDKVSQKLRMISSFNDQINERIKNIIVCFEDLRNKL